MNINRQTKRKRPVHGVRLLTASERGESIERRQKNALRMSEVARKGEKKETFIQREDCIFAWYFSAFERLLCEIFFSGFDEPCTSNF